MKKIITILLMICYGFLQAQEIRYDFLANALNDIGTFKKELLALGYLNLPEHNYEENGETIELYIPDTTKEQSHYYYISTISKTFNLKLRESALDIKHILILEINQSCIRKDKQTREKEGSLWEEWSCENDIGIKYKFENNRSSFYFIKFEK
jgi:hypothetical protein